MRQENIIEVDNEVRLQDGVPFPFIKSISSIENFWIGEDFCLGEMPREAWITYDNNIYQIIRFDNNTGFMICRDKFNVESIHQLDSSDNATYWGYWENIPQNYHSEN